MEPPLRLVIYATPTISGLMTRGASARSLRQWGPLRRMRNLHIPISVKLSWHAICQLPVGEYAVSKMPLESANALSSFWFRYGCILVDGMSGNRYKLGKTYSTWFTAGTTFAVLSNWVRLLSTTGPDLSMSVGKYALETYVFTERFETPIALTFPVSRSFSIAAQVSLIFGCSTTSKSSVKPPCPIKTSINRLCNIFIPLTFRCKRLRPVDEVLSNKHFSHAYEPSNCSIYQVKIVKPEAFQTLVQRILDPSVVIRPVVTECYQRLTHMTGDTRHRTVVCSSRIPLRGVYPTREWHCPRYSRYHIEMLCPCVCTHSANDPDPAYATRQVRLQTDLESRHHPCLTRLKLLRRHSGETSQPYMTTTM